MLLASAMASDRDVTTRPSTSVPANRSDPRVRARVATAVLVGELTVDEAARRMWVLPEVIEDWCAVAAEVRRADEAMVDALRRENVALRSRVQALVGHVVELRTRLGHDASDVMPPSGVRILGPEDDRPAPRKSGLVPAALPDDFVMELDATAVR